MGVWVWVWVWVWVESRCICTRDARTLGMAGIALLAGARRSRRSSNWSSLCITSSTCTARTAPREPRAKMRWAGTEARGGDERVRQERARRGAGPRGVPELAPRATGGGASRAAAAREKSRGRSGRMSMTPNCQVVDWAERKGKVDWAERKGRQAATMGGFRAKTGSRHLTSTVPMSFSELRRERALTGVQNLPHLSR